MIIMHDKKNKIPQDDYSNRDNCNYIDSIKTSTIRVSTPQILWQWLHHFCLIWTPFELIINDVTDDITHGNGSMLSLFFWCHAFLELDCCIRTSLIIVPLQTLFATGTSSTLPPFLSLLIPLLCFYQHLFTSIAATSAAAPADAVATSAFADNTV